MTVTFIAAPLVSPGGVYHSVTELVAAARAEGHDWRALVVARGWTPAERGLPAPDGVRVATAGRRRLAGLRELTGIISADDAVRAADTIVTLIPQSDLVYALHRRRLPPARWIAYLRGLPWPEPGEAPARVRAVKRAVARLALGAADERWAVSEVLARQVGLPAGTPVIPPGIDVDVPLASARGDQPNRPFTLGWMGRYEPDKDPMFFVELVRATGLRGVMFGSGRLRERLIAAAGPDVQVHGWVDRDDALARMDAYVGTSTREAFGRIPVEAAAFGVPSLLASSYGCAPYLYADDPDLGRALVLDKSDPAGTSMAAWSSAATRLASDVAFRERAIAAARGSAGRLTTTAAIAAIAHHLTPAGAVSRPSS